MPKGPRLWVVPIVVLVSLAVGGCGSDGGDAGRHAKTSTSVSVTVTHDDKTSSLKVNCPGSSEVEKSACGDLEALPVAVFKPVAPDVACTMIYGGPETATIAGEIKGKKVDAKFDRTNGCEIDRWNKVAPILTSLGLLPSS